MATFRLILFPDVTVFSLGVLVAIGPPFTLLFLSLLRMFGTLDLAYVCVFNSFRSSRANHAT